MRDVGRGKMKIYWTKKSIPELSQMSSSERNHLWRQCYKEAMHERQSKISLIIVGLLAGIGAMLLGPIGAGIGGGLGDSFLVRLSQTKFAHI